MRRLQGYTIISVRQEGDRYMVRAMKIQNYTVLSSFSYPKQSSVVTYFIHHNRDLFLSCPFFVYSVGVTHDPLYLFYIQVVGEVVSGFVP